MQRAFYPPPLSLALLLLLPVAAYFILLAVFNLDIPKADDYNDSLRIFVQLEQSSDLHQKQQIFFQQHGEHRTVFNRLIYWLSLQTTGRLDYLAFIYLGNFFLLLLACCYLLCLARERRSWLFAIPLLFLVFQPSAYRSMFWAMASLSNYAVMFWAMSSCYLVVKREYHTTALALVFASLAGFSQVNGLLVFPLAAAFLLVNAVRERDRKSLSLLLLWVLVAAAVLALFFDGYQPRSLTQPPPHPKGVFADSSLDTSLGAKVHWFFALLGSALAFGNAQLATAIGVATTLVIGVLLAKGRQRELPAIALYLAFSLGTVAMAAVGRSFFLDIQASQSSRYTFYSSQVIAVVLAIVVIELARYRHAWSRALSRAIAIGCIGIALASYAANLEKIRQEQAQTLRGMWLWNTRQDARRLAPLVVEPGEVLREAQDLGLYAPPPISHLPPAQWGRFAQPVKGKAPESGAGRPSQ